MVSYREALFPDPLVLITENKALENIPMLFLKYCFYKKKCIMR